MKGDEKIKLREGDEIARTPPFQGNCWFVKRGEEYYGTFDDLSCYSEPI